MLLPDQSILVLVDGPSNDQAAGIGDGLLRVSRCARALEIPIIAATYPGQLPAGLIGQDGGLVEGVTRIAFEPNADEWPRTPLARALAETGRRQLLICGYWLEEGITLLAHHALRAGLDPYVCVDVARALRPEHVPILQMRLVQHNVVVTTSEQAVREWLALTTVERRDAAQRILDAPPLHSP